MFELVHARLPETVRACRLLYDTATGGYHLPSREEQPVFGLADVDRMRAAHTKLQYDCIEAPVADLLCSLVVNTRSRLILETGTSRGFSTAHLAAAARSVHGDEARVVSLDKNEVPNRFFVGGEVQASIDARLVDSLSQDPRELSQGAEFDFLFLDSMHSYDHLGQEIERFLPHLKLGGLMVLHDTFFYDGLGLVTLTLMQLPGLEVLSFPTHRRHNAKLRSPGVTLFRKVAPIAVGSLRFPREMPGLATELVAVKDPEAVLARAGMGVARAPYAAQRLPLDGPRVAGAPALLDPWQPPVAVVVPLVVASPAPPTPLVQMAPAAPAAPAVAELRRRAFDAAANGDMNRGVDLLEQALRGGAGDVDVLCDLATLALSANELVSAVKLARRALDYAPDHAPSLYALGMALAQGGAVAPAIRALRSVASGPGAAALRAELGGVAADNVAPMLRRLEARAA
ncbi:MAG: class I SAM-dependent methyltransferase [Rubrivivax sp.]|nr:class I SAM-dependent methyltransferase [Rubrivivax sp.]